MRRGLGQSEGEERIQVQSEGEERTQVNQKERREFRSIRRRGEDSGESEGEERI